MSTSTLAQAGASATNLDWLNCHCAIKVVHTLTLSAGSIVKVKSQNLAQYVLLTIKF